MCMDAYAPGLKAEMRRKSWIFQIRVSISEASRWDQSVQPRMVRVWSTS